MEKKEECVCDLGCCYKSIYLIDEFEMLSRKELAFIKDVLDGIFEHPNTKILNNFNVTLTLLEFNKMREKVKKIMEGL